MDKNIQKNGKYNTRVRQAMSEEYVKSGKKAAELQREYIDILYFLENNKDKLIYNEYISLQKKAEDLKQQYEDEQIRIDTWDKAREICFDVADEVF